MHVSNTHGSESYFLWLCSGTWADTLKNGWSWWTHHDSYLEDVRSDTVHLSPCWLFDASADLSSKFMFWIFMNNADVSRERRVNMQENNVSHWIMSLYSFYVWSEVKLLQEMWMAWLIHVFFPVNSIPCGCVLLYYDSANIRPLWHHYTHPFHSPKSFIITLTHQRHVTDLQSSLPLWGSLLFFHFTTLHNFCPSSSWSNCAKMKQLLIPSSPPGLHPLSCIDTMNYTNYCEH